MQPLLKNLALGLLAALLLPEPGSATDLNYSHGSLGNSLTLELTGTPFSLGVLSLALGVGPTPLFCGPVAGLEQSLGSSVVLTALALSVTGEATLVQPLPSNPLLAGLDIYAQALEWDPLLACPIVDVSNPLRFSLVPLATGTLGVGDMHHPRSEHSFTPLPDGTALVAGGKLPDPNNPLLVNSLEIYDPQREEFELLTTTLSDARAHHQAVALKDGRVLIMGGVGTGGTILQSVEGFLRAPRSISTLAPMARPRVLFSATVLPDGRVLVLGGLAGQFNLKSMVGFPQSFWGPSSQGPVLSGQPELFDPQTNTWSPLPIANLSSRAGHQATLLKDGTVMVTGGLVFDNGTGRLVTTPRIEIINPSNWSVTVTQNSLLSRAFHASIAKSQGGALFVGGGQISYTLSALSISTQNSPPMSYNQVGLGTGTFTAAPPLPDPAPARILLCVPQNGPNPKYFVVPCPDPPPPAGTPPPGGPLPTSGTVYLYDEPNNLWNPIGGMTYDRPGHRAVHFEAQARTAIVGSAFPNPPGTPGTFDVTHEVFAPLP